MCVFHKKHMWMILLRRWVSSLGRVPTKRFCHFYSVIVEVHCIFKFSKHIERGFFIWIWECKFTMFSKSRLYLLLKLRSITGSRKSLDCLLPNARLNLRHFWLNIKRFSNESFWGTPIFKCFKLLLQFSSVLS